MVYVGAVGEVDAGALDAVAGRVSEVFAPVPPKPIAWPDPGYAWDAARGQCSSTLILRQLLEDAPPDAARVLGVTERDLFIPMLSFVFGQAQLGGRVALLSLARLRQEFYGLPSNTQLLAERARKEALHELGHTFSLVHCPRGVCAMALSTNIGYLDLKLDRYCASCARLLARRLRRVAEDTTI